MVPGRTPTVIANRHGDAEIGKNNRLPDLDRFYMSGELALSGQLRPIKGVLSIALEARRRRRQTLIVPLDNAAEAAVVEGVDVYGPGSLSEVVQFLRGEISPAPVFGDRMAGWPGGAFRMGLKHGGYCLGCCWASMVLLFVFGVSGVKVFRAS